MQYWNQLFVSCSYEFQQILLFTLDSAQNCSQCDKTQEPALRTVSGFLEDGGLLGLMFTF